MLNRTLFGLSVALLSMLQLQPSEGYAAAMGDVLTPDERGSVDSMKLVDPLIFARKRIVLVWPKEFKDFDWESAHPAPSLEKLADWIDALYGRMASDRIFGFDPQTLPNPPKWAVNRLVIGFFYYPEDQAWGGCWNSRNLLSWCQPHVKHLGTRDFIGVLFHEMTHYFGQFRFHFPGQVEGIADFFRYYLNLYYGWTDISEPLRKMYLENCFSNGMAAYHGAAGALIDLYEKGGFANVPEFMRALIDSEFRIAFPPIWELFGNQGIRDAAVAYCRETRGMQDQIPADAEADYRQAVLEGIVSELVLVQDLIHFYAYHDATEVDPRAAAWAIQIKAGLKRLASDSARRWPVLHDMLTQAASGKLVDRTLARSAQRDVAQLLHLIASVSTRSLFRKEPHLEKFSGLPVEPGLKPELTARGYRISTKTQKLPVIDPVLVATTTMNDVEFFDREAIIQKIDVGTKTFFSVELEGFLMVPAKGRYLVTLGSDDGSALKMHGRTLLDLNGLHGYWNQSAEVELDVGLHPLALAYFQGEGDAALSLWVTPLDGAAPATYVRK